MLKQNGELNHLFRPLLLFLFLLVIAVIEDDSFHFVTLSRPERRVEDEEPDKPDDVARSGRLFRSQRIGRRNRLGPHFQEISLFISFVKSVRWRLLVEVCFALAAFFQIRNIISTH